MNKEAVEEDASNTTSQLNLIEITHNLDADPKFRKLVSLCSTLGDLLTAVVDRQPRAVHRGLEYLSRGKEKSRMSTLDVTPSTRCDTTATKGYLQLYKTWCS